MDSANGWATMPPPYIGQHSQQSYGPQYYEIGVPPIPVPHHQQERLPHPSAFAPPFAPLLSYRHYQPVPVGFYHPAQHQQPHPYHFRPAHGSNGELTHQQVHGQSRHNYAYPYAWHPIYPYEQMHAAMPPPPYRPYDAQGLPSTVYGQHHADVPRAFEQRHAESWGEGSNPSDAAATNFLSALTSVDHRTSSAYYAAQPQQVHVDQDSLNQYPQTHCRAPVSDELLSNLVGQATGTDPARVSTTNEVQYDLVSNISTVPPPPPIERSAVPLADLATELVWEIVSAATASHDHGARWSEVSHSSPTSFDERGNEITSRLRHSYSSTRTDVSVQRLVSPNTPDLYGAVGDRRVRKVPHNDGSSSDSSSPSSSTPGTPSGADAVEAALARKERLLGFGYGVGFASKSEEDIRVTSPVEVIRTHARGLSHRSCSMPAATHNVMPSVAFRQFVRQILTATLLAPEDLVLALYYISKIPKASMLFPEPNSGASSKASALKAAPFKALLGALILSNKTLQDNSYRNETFAAVSGVPLKDVNEVEIHVFAALNFSVTVGEEEWKNWLTTIHARVQAVTSSDGSYDSHLEVAASVERLSRSALGVGTRPSSPAGQQFAVDSLGVSDKKCMDSLEQNIDLDESGPLKSPFRYDRRDGLKTLMSKSPTRIAMTKV